MQSITAFENKSRSDQMSCSETTHVDEAFRGGATATLLKFDVRLLAFFSTASTTMCLSAVFEANDHSIRI